MNATNSSTLNGRRVPPEMWTEILKAEQLAANINVLFRTELREEICKIAKHYGFTEQDAISCGLINPPRPPNPHHLKGGR